MRLKSLQNDFPRIKLVVQSAFCNTFYDATIKVWKFCITYRSTSRHILDTVKHSVRHLKYYIKFFSTERTIS